MIVKFAIFKQYKILLTVHQDRESKNINTSQQYLLLPSVILKLGTKGENLFCESARTFLNILKTIKFYFKFKYFNI